MEQVFVGRQPIYDGRLDVYGYELLFRDASGRRLDGDAMTGELLINAVVDIGIDVVTGGKLAFINLSEGFLDGRYPLPLAPDRIGLEVLETVEPTPAILAHLKALAREGYVIALDDFRFRPGLEPLLDLAAIVKLDVLALGEQGLRQHVAKLRPRGIKLVAEKVESYEEFELCRALGFDFFQGYFFAKPHLVQGRSMRANRAVLMGLLSRLQDSEASLKDLEALIVQDVSLTYRLLRHINSASYGLRREVDSIRQALLLLGTQNIRNFASLILLTRMEDKPRELLNTALVRAKMCEHLGRHKGAADCDQYFAAGLFSVLDALMDRPMHDLIQPLPLAAPIKAALLRFEGEIGDALRRVIDYERAAWERLDDGRHEPAAYTRSFIDALQWARDTTRSLQAG